MKEYKPLPKELEQIIEDLEFSISYSDSVIEFYYNGSDISYDFIFCCDNVDAEDLDIRISEIAHNLYSTYENFDVSYEAYLWLDDTGHGTNGAPYDMKNIYEEMEICENLIEKVWLAVSDYQRNIL